MSKALSVHVECQPMPLSNQASKTQYLSLQNFAQYRINRGYGEALSALRFPHCPNLKEVSLTNHCETALSSFFHDEDLERVEKLTFVNTSAWMPCDILCISRYRNIHTLTLQADGIFFPDGKRYEDWIAAGNTPAHLPRLKALLAIGYIADYILESIRAPDLLSLRLETDGEAHHTLETIPTTLLTTLHSIDISFQPIPTPSWVPLLHAIVSEAPLLSDLFIAGWMKQDLEVEDWYRKLNVVCHYL